MQHAGRAVRLPQSQDQLADGLCLNGGDGLILGGRTGAGVFRQVLRLRENGVSLVGALEEVLGLVRCNAREPLLFKAARTGVAVLPRREECLLTQVLGGGRVLHHLPADGVDQPLIGSEQCRKLLTCLDRHYASPLSSSAYSYHYDVRARFSSKTAKTFLFHRPITVR